MNAARLAAPLDEAGVACSYATFSNDNDYTRLLPPGTEVIRLTKDTGGSSTLRMLKALPKLIALLNSRSFDVVIPVLEMPTLAVALARNFVRRRVIAISSVQNAFLRLWNDSSVRAERVMYRLVKAAYARMDGAIPLSRGVGADLTMYVPKLAGSVEVVNNIGLQHVPDRTESKSDGSVTRLVACGRLVTVKDYPTMLRAFAKLPPRLDVRLDIMGDGAQADTLVSLASELGIADRVHLRGFMPDPQSVMGQADIFLLTSISEGFGNVIVEAMALGVPVIATDCPYGPREILKDGLCGTLVPVGDDDALASAIERLIEDDAARERFASLGRDRAQDFSPQVIGAQFLASLNRLASQAE